MNANAHSAQTWLVVADGERAAVYVRQRKERFVPMRAKQGATHDHYNATSEWELQPVRQLAGEAPEAYDIEQRKGRSFDSAGHHRHRTGDKLDIQDELSRRLMDDLASMLNDAFVQHEFHRLVIAAPPKLLGELRAKLDKQVQQVVIAELDKNLSNEPLPQLADMFSDTLRQAR